MMTSVCDAQLSPSFHHADGLLIDGKLWHTVTEYVSAGGDLYNGMLHKVCQNLHLQPLLAGQLQHQQSYAVPSLLSQCFEWLFSEFCPRLPGDMFELVHCLATCNAHVQNITVGFFQRCQPFAGATRAVVLTNMYCQKLMLGCSYADDIEQVLRAYEPQLNTQE